MKTNEKQNIKTDWAISGIVKPGHMNSLTRHVPYDYIITDKMLEGLSGAIDVDMLLNPADPDTGDEGGGMIHGRTGEYHVLINTPVPDNIILEFPASSTGDLAGDLKVHVYAFGPYNARVSAGTSTPNANITHYFHTAGDENAVTLHALGYNTYVGSFDLPYGIELGQHHTFYYEKALGNIPDQPQAENATIVRKAWMSNAVGSGGGESVLRIFDVVAKNDVGRQHLRMALGDEVLAQVTNQNLETGPLTNVDPYNDHTKVLGMTPWNVAPDPLDISGVAAIEWVTWHGAGVAPYSCTYQGRTINYWDVYNPYRCLTLDTIKMPIGKILKIHVEVVKSNHDPEVPVVNVQEIRNAYYLSYTSAGVEGEFVAEMDRRNMPTVNGATGSLTLQLASGYYATLPTGVSANDIVFILEYGGARGLAIFSSTSSERPMVPLDGSATTLQCTVTTDADGYIVVKFTTANRGEVSRDYTWKIPSEALMSVVITPNDREINFRRYEPHIYETVLKYNWEDDPQPFRIYAPLAGPRFYWPYLMARPDGGGHGASELKLRFRKIRDYPTKVDYGADYGSENVPYVPEEPHYESVVYMCRIDNDHVLVLGY